MSDKIDYIIFASGGNDSIALVDYASVKKLKNVVVCYSNTGWAAPNWAERMEKFKTWVESLGFRYHELASEGMENLIRRKKAFPANGLKFCTYELKIAPALVWLEEIDPNKEAICMVGVRREESPKRRNWAEFVEESENHGGRSLWSPLVNLKEETRNDILSSIGWLPLNHRSKECSPCVNANRTDFRAVGEADIQKVERMEAEMGKTMFRVKRFKGASGIREERPP